MHHPQYKIIAIVLAMLIIAGCAGISSAVPITTLTISGPKFGSSPEYVNVLTEFSLSASPDSNIWYHWDSYNYTKYTDPFTAIVEMPSTDGAPTFPIDLEDGLHTLYYNSTDSTGQNEVPKSKSVYLDLYVPTTTVVFIGVHYSGTNEFIKTDTQINLTSIDTGSGIAHIEYKIDNGQYLNYIEPFTMTNPGQHTIVYHAIDNVGNQETDKSAIIFVDNNPPTVEIIPGTPSIAVSSTRYVRSTTLITLNAQDNSGIAESSYSIDSGTWTNYATPFTVATEGRHIISGRATDNIGYSSVETTQIIYVDNTPPVVTINGSSSDVLNIKKGDTISFICSDAGVDQCTIFYHYGNTTTWNEYMGPFTVNENQALTYYASDGVGNNADEETVYVSVAESGDWNIYLGGALIVGGVLIGISAFIYFRKKQDPKFSKPEEKKEKQEKPKNKKKRRNY